MGDGVRCSGGFLASETVSAWKNLLSACDLPTAESGGDVMLNFRGGSSCLPLAWKKTDGAFFCGGGCSRGLASLAWKNREEDFPEPVSAGTELCMLASGGREGGANWLLLGPGVLRGRLLLLVATLSTLCPLPCSFGGKSIVEAGREEVGVLIGVPLGEDKVLSTPTRDFLDEERGVMLLFRNAFTGVTSSTTTLLTLGVVALLLRTLRPVWEPVALAAEGVAASRGVRGVFAVRLLASFGLRLFWGFRSMGILLA
jgi:hypothetical protein